MSAQLGRANALVLDLFQVFIAPLETELQAKSSHAAGRSHGIAEQSRILRADRGHQLCPGARRTAHRPRRDLSKAQVILVGVSRCGKTPTTLYLALQFGTRAANFPLTPDDFADKKLPASVLPYPRPLVWADDQSGTVAANSRRASSREFVRHAEKCRYEVREAEQMMQREQITMLDTTTKSIEEFATTILHRAGLQRHA